MKATRVRGVCLIEDCGRTVHYLKGGWCKRHYQIWYRTGSTTLQPRLTVEQRFWRKVSLGDGCWEWLASITADGYGQFNKQHAKPVPAHRYCYELLVEPVPAHLQMDHLCRNRSCVNPDHLEPVPGWVNNMRSNSVTARNARKTHCRHGHEFSLENTYLRPAGGRTCITCRELNKQRYRAEAG